MKIANIVYENELVNHEKLDYINYFNESIEYNKLDKSLPTLYVGWSFMKLCNPNDSIIQNANILHKKIITNELYWECSFEESKGSHIKGLERFIDSIPIFYFTSKYEYINLDPIFFQLRDIDDLMDVIPKNIESSYKFKNEMFYLLYDDKIWGLNLDTFKYFKFNVDDILNRILLRTQSTFLDTDGEQYQQYYKLFPNFVQLKRYAVVIRNIEIRNK